MDGKDYMEAVANAISMAESEIYITDWQWVNSAMILSCTQASIIHCKHVQCSLFLFQLCKHLNKIHCRLNPSIFLKRPACEPLAGNWNEWQLDNMLIKKAVRYDNNRYRRIMISAEWRRPNPYLNLQRVRSCIEEISWAWDRVHSTCPWVCQKHSCKYY